MKSIKAIEFLSRHGMISTHIDPAVCAVKMLSGLREGLEGEGATVPMIPTYLKTEGSIPVGATAAVIDAGGTNFRCALATFTENGCVISDSVKKPMPGIGKSVTWEEFISFVADNIEPLMDRTDRIGFCFSYSAVITPEVDGRVIRIDKEVVVTGSEGRLIGASLIAELSRRGIHGKKAVILNDTAAALLGVAAGLDRSLYGGFIGQISGTGANTCCILPMKDIPKLGRCDETPIIVNLESGLYDGLPAGDFDRILDSESNNPGLKQLEKMISGVYVGKLTSLMLTAAADEGFISSDCGERVKALGNIDASYPDAWANGERLDEICVTDDDKDFVRTLCFDIFDRSARCMCTNLLAILLLTGEGTDKPVCVCAEGSMVQKGHHFRPLLESYLDKYALGVYGRRTVLNVGYETTLPGSAAAAILS